MNSSIRFWTIGGLGVAVIGLVALASAVLRPASRGDAEDFIRVVEPGSPTQEFQSIAAAEAHVAERVGFDEIVPGALPKGFQPTVMALSPLPPNGGPSLRRVTVEFEGAGDASFRLLAVGRTFDFPDRNAEHRIGQVGAGHDLYRSDDEQGLEYTLVTEDRGWIVSLPVGSRVTEQDVRNMLASLVGS